MWGWSCNIYLQLFKPNDTFPHNYRGHHEIPETHAVAQPYKYFFTILSSKKSFINLYTLHVLNMIFKRSILYLIFLSARLLKLSSTVMVCFPTITPQLWGMISFFSTVLYCYINVGLWTKCRPQDSLYNLQGIYVS